MSGRICVITGATSGIGRATALALASLGFDLCLIGRNQTLGQRVAAACRARNPRGRAEFLRADLGSQNDVRSAANVVMGRFRQVDVLVNNAGARNDRYGESPEGIEQTFAVNHLGHFLLTQLLLEQLRRGHPGRVITVASVAHKGADLRHGWISAAPNYDRGVAYANSKLANIVFARELAARNDPAFVVSNAVDPGIVATRFARNNGLWSWLKHVLSSAAHRQLISARRGADTVVFLARSDELPVATGRYFHRCVEIAPEVLAQDPELSRQLWTLSSEMTGITEPSV